MICVGYLKITKIEEVFVVVFFLIHRSLKHELGVINKQLVLTFSTKMLQLRI